MLSSLNKNKAALIEHTDLALQRRLSAYEAFKSVESKSRALEEKTQAVLEEIEVVSNGMSVSLERLDFVEKGVEKAKVERDDAKSRPDKALDLKRKREETILAEAAHFTSSSASLRASLTLLYTSAAHEASLSLASSLPPAQPPSPQPCRLAPALVSLDKLQATLDSVLARLALKRAQMSELQASLLAINRATSEACQARDAADAERRDIERRHVPPGNPYRSPSALEAQQSMQPHLSGGAVDVRSDRAKFLRDNFGELRSFRATLVGHFAVHNSDSGFSDIMKTSSPFPSQIGVKEEDEDDDEEEEERLLEKVF